MLPMFLAGGRHMQSQAAILVFPAHFVFSLPISERLRRTWESWCFSHFSKTVDMEAWEARGFTPKIQLLRVSASQITAKNYSGATW